MKALLCALIRFIIAKFSKTRKPKTGFYSILASFGLNFGERSCQPQMAPEDETEPKEPQPILEVDAHWCYLLL